MGKRRSVNNIAQMQAAQRGMQIWESLDTLLLECQALRTSPSNALLLIKNPELVDRAVADKSGLLSAAKVLSKDVREYTDKLNAIQVDHQTIVQNQKGDPTAHPDTLASLMGLAESYSNWIESYQLVVIPSAFNVTRFFTPQVQAQTPGLPLAQPSSI